MVAARKQRPGNNSLHGFVWTTLKSGLLMTQVGQKRLETCLLCGFTQFFAPNSWVKGGCVSLRSGSRGDLLVSDVLDRKTFGGWDLQPPSSLDPFYLRRTGSACLGGQPLFSAKESHTQNNPKTFGCSRMFWDASQRNLCVVDIIDSRLASWCA